MKIIYPFLFFILFHKTCFPQFENIDIGAKPISLAGAFTSLANNSNAVYYNPSGIGQISYREISVFYSPAPFGLNELSYGALTYIEPTIIGSFGLSTKTYGFDLYRELTFTFSYANNYKQKLYYGANVNYNYLKIKNYGSDFTIAIDGGLLAYLTNYLRWGFTVLNINRAKIGKAIEKLPQIYRTGLSVQIRKDLNFVVDLEKDTRYKPSIKSGIEFSLYDFIELRSGVSSEPTKFSAGFGIFYSIFQIDYAFHNHQDLGITHQASLTLNFGGSEVKRNIRDTYGSVFESLTADTLLKKKKKEKLKEGETININAASVEELMRLPYVSETIANAIIEYRNKHGGFKTAQELMNVKGIKQKRFEKIKPYVRLE